MNNTITYRTMQMLCALSILFSSMAVAIAQVDSTSKEVSQSKQFTDAKLKLIEENLVRDLENPAVGVCIGGAQAIRELKAKVPHFTFSKVINPLMHIVKDEQADRAARILAALALSDLDSERGNFAIQREGELASDELFKTLCVNLTKVRKEKNRK